MYNIGTKNHTVSDRSTPVNDGRYHVVRYTRSGSNATIQLDGEIIIYRNPKGMHLLFVRLILKPSLQGCLQKIKTFYWVHKIAKNKSGP